MASLLTSVCRQLGKGSLRSLPSAGSADPAALTNFTGCGSLQATPAMFGPMTQDKRYMQNRGVLKLRCSECRYVIKRWHVPILAVDCNANVRHKQAMTNLPPRSRWSVQVPDYLRPWLEGKQYPRNPHYRQEHTFHCYSKKKHLKLR
eukprot:symbB.v1.2.017868.t1/scaffold1334.1/size124731/2